MKKLLLILGLILITGPIVLGMAAGLIASALHCTVNEGYASGCMLFGMDISDTLYTLTVGIWYTLITAPIGAAAMIAAAVIWIVQMFTKKAAQVTPPADSE